MRTNVTIGSLVPGNETSTLSFPGTNVHCVVVSFPGTKVHGNETSKYRKLGVIFIVCIA